ncbi:HD family phosphohydrolase [Gorillibacterium massiliense]|uniref:HD family phosphohydrolase n=1 Tax=Gorillibacterium massiliense TaxID=1280390 RepID=UPI0009DD58E3|nr:HDIG domain-containing metalloprotein [Gorillibacterium massiliense]
MKRKISSPAVRSTGKTTAKSFTWMNGWKYSAFIRFFLFLLIGVILYFSLADRLIPKTYDIQPNTESETTVLAPRQIKDDIATAKAQEAAAQQVGDVYYSVNPRSTVLISTLYDKLELSLTDTEMQFEERVSYYRSVFPRVLEEFTDESVRIAGTAVPGNTKLTDEMKKQYADQEYKITEEAYYKMPRLTVDDLGDMENVTREIVAKLSSDPLTDVRAVRGKVTQLVNSSSLAKSTQREIVQEISKLCLLPDRFYDATGTEKAKDEARGATKPVYIDKNDVLIRKGDYITQDVYDRLNAAGLLNSEKNYKPALGLALFTVLAVTALFMQVRRSTHSIAQNNAQLLMLLVIILINIVGIRIVALGQNLEYPFVGYLAPVALGVTLCFLLLDTPLAVALTILFAIVSSAVFNAEPDRLFDFRFGFAALASGYAAIFSLHRVSQRFSVLKAGLAVSLFSTAAVTAIILISNSFSGVAYALGYALASGVITAVLAIGLIPFFEAVFGILSPLKLSELSNPNHPLLRKLLTEAPGTYHHSVMVGNLAEAAAEAIGADGLLCRVGSYYHDIGKTKRPSYFIENQLNMENPHDSIDPGLSTSIITAHARDGVEMLLEHKIPKGIRDIAEQHHGTTLLKSFYYKAVKQQGDNPQKPVQESDYRYPGPKAQSKEAAVVGIADSVEAAVRSLRHPNIEQIDQMVRKIIKDRLDDGQFDECDLTLRELDTVGKTLKETLLGIFHSRIEYPSDLPPARPSQTAPQESSPPTLKKVDFTGQSSHGKPDKEWKGGA